MSQIVSLSVLPRILAERLGFSFREREREEQEEKRNGGSLISPQICSHYKTVQEKKFPTLNRKEIT